MESTELPENLKAAVAAGVSPLDIMHGELKNLMYEAEQEYLEAKRIEEENDFSDAMQSMERRYWEGQLEALSYLYSLTYKLSFEKNWRESWS